MQAKKSIFVINYQISNFTNLAHIFLSWTVEKVDNCKQKKEFAIFLNSIKIYSGISNILQSEANRARDIGNNEWNRKFCLIGSYIRYECKIVSVRNMQKKKAFKWDNHCAVKSHILVSTAIKKGT